MNSENYKINPDKWIPASTSIGEIHEKYKLNPAKWTNNENKWSNNENKWMNNEKKNLHSKKKYYLATILFIFSLIVVSTIKNETRNLEKEISDLQASLGNLKNTLHEAFLDHEVIASPENISKLAKEHLEDNFGFYKKNQLKRIDIDEEEKLSKKLDEKKSVKKFNKKTKVISNEVKIQLSKKIEEKKAELKYYQALYSKPERLPNEIKLKISKNITSTKRELEKLYSDPKETIGNQKVQRWAMIQIIKAFLGIPFVPGK